MNEHQEDSPPNVTGGKSGGMGNLVMLIVLGVGGVLALLSLTDTYKEMRAFERASRSIVTQGELRQREYERFKRALLRDLEEHWP